MQAAFLLPSAANRSHPLAICPDFRRFAAAFCFPNPMVAVRLCGFAKDKPRLIQRVACADGCIARAAQTRVRRSCAAVGSRDGCSSPACCAKCRRCYAADCQQRGDGEITGLGFHCEFLVVRQPEMSKPVFRLPQSAHRLLPPHIAVIDVAAQMVTPPATGAFKIQR